MRIRIFIFATIFLPTYALYLITMPPTVFWQDSGIYLAGLKHFGIIYPPGFPLYMILGVLWLKIISFLPLPLNFTQQVHAFSGLWGAGAAGLVGLTVYELVQSVGASNKTTDDGRRVARGGEPHAGAPGLLAEWDPRGAAERQDPSLSWITTIFIAIISGLTAGFSYSLWAQSINAEVYSMIGFFAALLLFLAANMIKDYRQPPFTESSLQKMREIYRKYIFLIALIFGLSLAIHLQTITFIIPFLIFFFILRLFPFFKVKISDTQNYQSLLPAKTWLLASVIFLLSAFTPYLYLPIRSAANPAVVWSKIDSPRAFADHVSGKTYRTAEDAIKPPGKDKLESYPILFFQEFFVLGIILGLVGLIKVFKNGLILRSFGLLGVSQAVILYLLISFYERGTEYNFWLVPFYLYFSILIGIGMWWLVKKLTVIARSPFGERGDLSEIASPPASWRGARNDNLSKFPLRSFCVKFFLISFLALGLLLPQLWINWPLLNRSNYTLPEEFGKNLIGKLPEKSVFFTIGDQESAIPLYLQKVLGYRLDVNIVSDTTFTAGRGREGLVKTRPDLTVPAPEEQFGTASPEKITEYINEFVRENVDKNLFVITKNYLPLSPEFKLIPAGTIWQIVKIGDDPPIDLSFWNYQFSDPGRYHKPERQELSRKKTDFLDGKPVITYQRAPYSDEAKVFELQAKKNLGDYCFGAHKEKRTIQIKNLSGEREVWQDDKLIQCAISSYEAMFETDPQFYHREVFLNLAEIYKKMGKEIEAEDLIKKTEEKH